MRRGMTHFIDWYLRILVMFSSFCLDTKAWQKIKADEKKLKRYHSAQTRKTPRSFVARRTILVFSASFQSFFDALFHRP